MKKILALLLSLILIVAFGLTVGCEKTTVEKTTIEKETTTPSPAPPTERTIEKEKTIEKQVVPVPVPVPAPEK